ncbi:murein biosynthesis integral membrane protein MurJ [Amaricoccus sp.]|uniref:murein biosynthesis integral membrane protein MurJ n=1 Tax=Amaricoccus sp. TaxID=1872485 RepID=UPI001B45D5F7|nr:murein biosynthesis integral membrane protein MurJ [Amaricoccus sp.]MBP7001968.1 murein biosynthesis integral membrane protein MurJ [Amaricoccus sp.]
MTGIRLLPAFLSVGAWTMLSRILGLARDILMAAFLGAGPVAQAFLIAFTLPNMFRRFFAEGAFNLAFVPLFAKKVEAGEDAEGFARDALSGLGLVLLVFTILGQIAMPWLVLAMASGFAGDERFALSVEHGRIAFPYIILISLTALLSGVLNSLGRFALPAAAPILMNVVMIAFLLIGWRTGGDIGLWQIWSVPVSGVAQLALVWWGCARVGMPVPPRRPRLTPDMRRLTVIMVPALLAGGVVQINLMVGRQVGSFFDGAVAWLSYADRLYQLPLGVVGIAIGVVLLPDLSRRLKAGDGSGGRDAINRATELTLALTLPAAVALMVIPVEIVRVLFERGAFVAADTWPTALAVAVYGAGLPAFVMQKVLSPLYYAREDTRSPFRFAVHAMIVNAAIALGLAPFIGFIAAALGTTVAGWVMMWQLWRGTGPMGEVAAPDARLRRAAPRIVLASILMGGVLLAVSWLLAPLFEDRLWRYGALALLVSAGMASYAAAVVATGGLRLADLRAALRRGG